MSTLMGRGKIRMSEGKGVVMKRVVKSNGKGEREGSCDEKGGKVQREGSCDEKGGKIQREGSCDEKGGKVQREGSCDEKGGKIQWEGSCDEKEILLVGDQNHSWSFLRHLVKDTSTKMSQYDVSSIIKEYINEHKLFCPDNRRKILCDERLKSVLGQKTVYRNQMCDLLQPHFIENLESSDEDELGLSSEAEDKNVMVACKKQRELITNRKSLEKEVVINAPQSCFASIVSENIKLVYLKRSLVQELLKQPKTFENKLIGSFVRVKLDPNDSFQRNSHQLVQVTDSPPGFKYVKDICISMLSDVFFSEEECEDLSQKVKDGLLKKPTIARSLHEDITKHWIARELNLLRNLIDRANEKGWRREFFEYMEKRQLPQKPSEQSRLLQVVPKVIADVSELETMANDAIKENKQGDESLPKSILLGCSAISGDSSKGSGFSSVAKKKRFLASIIEELDRSEPTLRETKRPRQFS
ncbi:uncharacterized protein At5g08430-like isoform X5 [Camellia sinensis]|uniref:uncharacterized protein At5g08430-like isoform X5 n=1 Tax=Camellia sinensis TaxID=4442 RepID=UPI001036C340|nr:uncharacterized protein At5g08430-like isoform X5 [Camellia sinensis]